MNEHCELRPPQEFLGRAAPSSSDQTVLSHPQRHITNDSTGTHVVAQRVPRKSSSHGAHVVETRLGLPRGDPLEPDLLAEVWPVGRRPELDCDSWVADHSGLTAERPGLRLCPQSQPSPELIDFISPTSIPSLKFPTCGALDKYRRRIRGERPRRIPELRVKHRSPIARPPAPGGITFRDKYRLQLRSPIKRLDTPEWKLPHLRTKLGICGGDGAGFREPPYPVPTSALGFATCWDEDVLRRKRESQKRSFCHEGPPPQPKSGGGLKSFVEDALGLSALALAEVVETVGNTLLQTVGPLPRSVEASPPQPLYADPRTGKLPKRPEAPTITTGHSLMDKVNRYLDEVLCDNETHPRLILSPGPITPPTKRTGNVIMDKTNRFLDKVMAPPPKKVVEPEAPRLPRSDMAQKIRCTLHCRDRCSFDRWDCAGLKFQQNWLQDNTEDEMPERSFLDRLLGQRKERKYREKVGERWCPSLYKREDYYCPHCERNRFTGKQRKRLELQWPLRVDRENNLLEGAVDFEISDLLAARRGCAEGGTLA